MSLQKVEKCVTEIYSEMNLNNSLWKKDPKEFKKIFEDKNKELIEKYSSVFNILFSPNFNEQGYERLLYMLKMAQRVENKDIAEHDASVAVGQRLVDEIVKPQIEKKNNI